MKELSTMLSEAYSNKTPDITLPLSLAKLSLSSSIARKWFHVEKEVLDYYIIDNAYDCSVTVADLEGSGIVCPDLKDTLEPMIDFYRKYKDDKTKHINIVEKMKRILYPKIENPFVVPISYNHYLCRIDDRA